MDLHRAGCLRHRRQPPHRCAPGGRSARHRAPVSRCDEEQPPATHTAIAGLDRRRGQAPERSRGRGPPRPYPRASGAFRGRGHTGIPQRRHHGTRRRRRYDLYLDLFPVQTAGCHLEPELRSPGHRPALRYRRLSSRRRQTPGHAADGGFILPVPYFRAGNSRAPEPAAGCRGRL